MNWLWLGLGRFPCVLGLLPRRLTLLFWDRLHDAPPCLDAHVRRGSDLAGGSGLRPLLYVLGAVAELEQHLERDVHARKPGQRARSVAVRLGPDGTGRIRELPDRDGRANWITGRAFRLDELPRGGRRDLGDLVRLPPRKREHVIRRRGRPLLDDRGAFRSDPIHRLRSQRRHRLFLFLFLLRGEHVGQGLLVLVLVLVVRGHDRLLLLGRVVAKAVVDLDGIEPHGVRQEGIYVPRADLRALWTVFQKRSPDGVADHLPFFGLRSGFIAPVPRSAALLRGFRRRRLVAILPELPDHLVAGEDGREAVGDLLQRAKLLSLAGPRVSEEELLVLLEDVGDGLGFPLQRLSLLQALRGQVVHELLTADPRDVHNGVERGLEVEDPLGQSHALKRELPVERPARALERRRRILEPLRQLRMPLPVERTVVVDPQARLERRYRGGRGQSRLGRGGAFHHGRLGVWVRWHRRGGRGVVVNGRGLLFDGTGEERQPDRSAGHARDPLPRAPFAAARSAPRDKTHVASV